MTDTNLSTAWLAGRTALITGGGRGIGKAVALHLASLGARIIVTGRTVAEIDAVAHETGGLAIRMAAAGARPRWW